ncbi:hypothetical protein WMW72_14485 [Paenibacillus filicis]|uniref:Uncharacterized protein n=1 Tax=Paenibacillus filicis TaxID=669464 RepID=A0ABU9DJT8_9BACL
MKPPESNLAACRMLRRGRGGYSAAAADLAGLPGCHERIAMFRAPRQL